MSNIKDTDKIDLVVEDDKKNEIDLVMIEEREWDVDNNMYYELEEKLSNYLHFIESGQIFEQYSDLNKEVSIGIRIYSMYELSTYAKKVIENIHNLLIKRGYRFKFKLLQEEK